MQTLGVGLRLAWVAVLCALAACSGGTSEVCALGSVPRPGGGCMLPCGAGTDAGTYAPVDAPPPACTTEWDAGDPRADLGGFVPAAHPPLAHVTNPAGHVCTHPQVVTITYETDPHAGAFEQLVQFAVTSSWLAAVGTEYGVGAGAVVATLRIPGDAPTTISNDELIRVITSQIAAGALPDSGICTNDFIYMIAVPPETTVTYGIYGAACALGWGGYHDDYTDSAHHFAYAVIMACDPSQTVGEMEYIASHELIEAATDPYPSHGPAFRIRDANDVWSLTSGEVGDLCVANDVTSCGHRLTRVWSNTAALAGGSPCVPVPSGDPFFSASTPLTTVQSVTPGQVLTVPVTGFSDRPLSDWNVFVTPYTYESTFTPDIAPYTFRTNNDRTTSVTITVPTTARVGDHATIYVISRASFAPNDYEVWPIGLRVH